MMSISLRSFVRAVDRHVQFIRCMEDTFQQDELGNVEVPNGETVFLLPMLLQ